MIFTTPKPPPEVLRLEGPQHVNFAERTVKELCPGGDLPPDPARFRREPLRLFELGLGELLDLATGTRGRTSGQELGAGSNEEWQRGVRRV